MKIKLFFSICMMFTFSFGFSQLGAPDLDIDWEYIPTPGASATGFAEKDGRMWVTNGQLYFSDDEGVTWQEHPELSGDSSLSFQNVFATENGITVVVKSNLGSSILFSNDNGVTFDFGGLGFGVTTEPDGSGYSGPYGFFRKSANEIIGIEYQTDELLGENYLVVGSLDSSEVSEEYFHASSGYVNTQIDSNDKHYFSIHHDTIADLIHEEYTTGKYKLALSQGLDTTFTIDVLPPDSFAMNFSHQFWYDAGKIYLLHPDSFVVVSSDLGISWTVLFSPEGNRVDRKQISFTERGILWNLASGLWISRYEDLGNPEFIYDFNSKNTNSYHSGDYNLYSAGDGIYLQSSTILEPDLRNNGILGEITFFNVFGQVWWVRANDVLFRSTDEGITWERETSPFVLTDLFNLKVFADFENLLYAYHLNMVYVSSDNGANWAPISTQLFDSELNVSKTTEEIYLFNGSRLLFSDDGINFSERTFPAGARNFITIDNELYAIGWSTRYISNDQGMNWSPPEANYGESHNPRSFHTGQLWSENNSFNPYHNFTISNDAGKTWIEHCQISQVPIDPITSVWLSYVADNKKTIFMRAGNYSYATSNLGRDWGRVPGPTGFINSTNLIINGNFLFSTSRQLYLTSLNSLEAQLSDTIVADNQLSGFLYLDDNENCVFDETDRPLIDKVISFGNRITTTNQEGWYGVFHTSIDSIEYYTDSLRHHLHNCEYSFTGNKLISPERSDTLSIAFDPVSGIIDGGLSVWPMGVFRPNGTPLLKVSVKNYGTEDIDNQFFNINFNPEQQDISAANAGILINDGTWQFPVNLLAGEDQVYWLEFLLNQDLTIDDTLNYEVGFDLVGDAYLDDNIVVLEIPVLSSFDPNDKTVYPAIKPLPGETTELVYRIRFQNTGTDTAFNVTVIDTLSENLNLYSLRVLEVSHNYDLQIDQGNIVRWNFNDILLPDSTTNESESHGFIYFKIDTKNDLMDGDLIPNLAAIYFDFNEPILTNQVVTEINDILISTKDLSDLPFTTKLQPNPTSLSTQLIFELENPKKMEMILFNEIGQQVQMVLASQVLEAGEHQVEWSMEALPSGIYFLKIENETGVKIVRVVKME